MKKLLLRIQNFFSSECNHRLRKEDVEDLSKDPECIFCHKKLSEMQCDKTPKK